MCTFCLWRPEAPGHLKLEVQAAVCEPKDVGGGNWTQVLRTILAAEPALQNLDTDILISCSLPWTPGFPASTLIVVYFILFYCGVKVELNFFKKIYLLFFMYVYVCVPVWIHVHHVYAGAGRGREQPYPLKLGL